MLSEKRRKGRWKWHDGGVECKMTVIPHSHEETESGSPPLEQELCWWLALARTMWQKPLSLSFRTRECFFHRLLPALGTGSFTSALCQRACPASLLEGCERHAAQTWGAQLPENTRPHQQSASSLPKERGHGGQKNCAPKPRTCARLQLYEQQTLAIFSHWVLGLCFMQHWLQTR